MKHYANRSDAALYASPLSGPHVSREVVAMNPFFRAAFFHLLNKNFVCGKKEAFDIALRLLDKEGVFYEKWSKTSSAMESICDATRVDEALEIVESLDVEGKALLLVALSNPMNDADDRIPHH